MKPVAPALLWQAENEGWIALGFEVGEGRRADVEPGDGGSADADDLGLGAADR
ncbi:hypothetical protein SSPO_060410 [Streptomyces antimycoticus]|uniref:Uncharacterized protein n=1 Tax=Streptomyces antimycoticus TaxID=68175 RepID=A0A499UNA2_9ACTN|nr:hypothetical protein SSPO_060410 [Streptomyces antimycoticus]